MNQKSSGKKVKSVTAVFLLVFVNMIAFLSAMPPVLGAGEKIYGTITIAGTSTPIVGANIQVISPVTGDFLQASSNATGNYSINLPMAGKYTVLIMKSGYSGDMQDLTITTGQAKLYNKSLQADTTDPVFAQYTHSIKTGISPNHASTSTLTINEKWFAVANVDILMVMSKQNEIDNIITAKRYTNMPLFNNPGNAMEFLNFDETAPGTNTTTFTFNGTSTIALFGDGAKTYPVPYGIPYWEGAGDVVIINGYYENLTLGANIDAWFLDFNATTLELQQIDRYVSATGAFIQDAVNLLDASGKAQIMAEMGTFNTTNGEIDTQMVNITPFININAIEPLVIAPTLLSGEYIVSTKIMDFGDNTARNWTTFMVDNEPPVADAGANISIKQGSKAQFNGSASTDNMGIVNYTWSYQGGKFYGWNATTPVLNTIGVYAANLNVTDEGGWIGSDVVYINVTDGIAPVADAGQNISVKQDVKFDLNGTASTDNIDTIAQLNYTWSFNDTVKNVTIYGPQPNHTLAKIGVYKLELIVEDRNGNKAAPAYVWVNVTDGHAPVANAGIDITVKQLVLTHFNGSASTDNVNIINYTWNFTDKATPVKLYGWNATYTFDTIGVYNVTLTVKDKAGMTGTDLMVVSVIDGIAPVAHGGADQSDEVNINMTFNASTSTDNVGIVVYNWSFGDGTTGLGKVVTHAWSTVGVYTVILTVKDAQNNSATDKVNVTVVPKNHAPTIANIVPQTAIGGVQFGLNPVFSDPDTTDILNFSLTNAPAGMTINSGTGHIAWTPATNQLWKSYDVTVTVSDSKATASRVFTIRTIAQNIIVKVGPIKDKDGKIVKGAEVTLLSGTNKYTNKTDSKGIASITVPGQLANQTVDYTVKKAGYKDSKVRQGSIATDGTFNPVSGYQRLESKQSTDYIFLLIVIVVLLVLALVLFSMKRPTDDDSVLDDEDKEPGEEGLDEEE